MRRCSRARPTRCWLSVAPREQVGCTLHNSNPSGSQSTAVEYGMQPRPQNHSPFAMRLRLTAELPIILHRSRASSPASPPFSLPTVVSDDLVGEMCRCAAGELHVVAAVVGAIAAQVGGPWWCWVGMAPWPAACTAALLLGMGSG